MKSKKPSSCKMSSNDSTGANSTTKPDNYQINAKICRLVERYPCMYDRSHTHYLKKDVADKAWVKIAKEMDDSIPSCKERWRNIRTSFARSINVNKVPACANRTKPYYLHEELQFLARHITPGIPISRRCNAYCSAGEESEVIEVSVGEESFDDFAARLRDEEEDSQGHQSSIDDYSEATKDESRLQQSKTQAPAMPVEEHELESVYIVPPKKRQRMMDSLAASAIEEMERERERALERELERERECERERERERDVKPMVLPVPESDFDAIFLQSLVPEIKAMNFCQKVTFKRRVFEVISEIFDSTANVNGNANAANSMVHSHINAAVAPAANNSITLPTMTLINSSDLAMIRRLNSLLHNSTVSVPAATSSSTITAATSSSTITASPKKVASISSTVRSAPAPAAMPTVAVHQGALTRATSTLLRVTMLNAPSSTVPTQLVKEEPDAMDD